MPKAVVHIGFHKTGTTSIQKFLEEHRPALIDHNIAFYEGRHIRQNHVELHLAAMRLDRMSPVKLKSGLKVNQAYLNKVREELRFFRQENSHRTLLFSAEGLSLLRYTDELCALRELIAVDELQIVAFLRNRDDWLRSYKSQLERRCQEAVHVGGTEFNDLSDDSWLLDFDARLETFKHVFGKQNVVSVDYNVCVARDGSVIPSILDLLEIKMKFPKTALASYWENKS